MISTSYSLIPKRRMLSAEYAAFANIPSASLRTEFFKNLSVTTAKIDDLAVTTAKITNLAVTDAKIDTLTVTKLTTGNLTAIGTITTGKLVTAASPNARIEISSTLIAGYSDATTKQFYLQASDGKAYTGGGAVILDSLGITVKGQYALFQDSAGVLRGVATGKTAAETGANPQFQFYGTDGTDVIVYSWETLYLTSLGNTIVSSDFLPANTNSTDLGSATKVFAEAHITTATVYTSLVPDATGGADLGTVSLYFSNAFINAVNVGTWLSPDTDGGATVGTVSAYFSNGYITTIACTDITALGTIRANTAFNANGTGGASGTITLATTTSITVSLGIITGWA